jgi:hypothetical protein
MFTKKELSLMRRLGLNFDFDNLSDDEWVELEDTVGDYLCLSCFDKDYNIKPEGVICEAILDKLP